MFVILGIAAWTNAAAGAVTEMTEDQAAGVPAEETEEAGEAEGESPSTRRPP